MRWEVGELIQSLYPEQLGRFYEVNKELPNIVKMEEPERGQLQALEIAVKHLYMTDPEATVEAIQRLSAVIGGYHYDED